MVESGFNNLNKFKILITFLVPVWIYIMNISHGLGEVIKPVKLINGLRKDFEITMK